MDAVNPRAQLLRNCSHKGFVSCPGTGDVGNDLIICRQTNNDPEGADMNAIALTTLLVHSIATVAVAIGTMVAAVWSPRR